MYIGGKEFPILLRVMDKCTDHRDPDDGTADELPLADRRARLEVSLPETKRWESAAVPLGLSTLGDLFGFDYKKSRRLFFEFYLGTIGSGDELRDLPFKPTLTETQVFQRTGVYGLDRFHRATSETLAARLKAGEIASEHVALGKKGRLVSYIELNQKVDRALKALASAWRPR
jgi:hypothetical protein